MANNTKTTEFRRYRQALTAIYLAVAAVGVVLIIASVVRELFFPPPRIGEVGATTQPDDDLQACHRDVVHLYQEPGHVSAALIAAPTTKDGNLGDEWDEFSRDWNERWKQVDASCRFSKLRGTRVSVGYDLMAQVHNNLPAMTRRYRSLIRRFDNKQAAELARMRHSLDRSMAALTEGEAPVQ